MYLLFHNLADIKKNNMKKVYLLLVGAVVLFQSCVMKEDIHVNKKGEVNYQFNINFSELMKMAPEGKASMGKDAEKAVDFFNGEEVTIDQYLDAILLKEENKEFKKDSLKSAHPEIFKNLETLRLQFTLNDSIGDLNFKLDAKNVEELNNSLTGLEQIGHLVEKSDPNVKQNMSINSAISDNTYYEFEKNIFERKIKTTESNKKQETTGMEEMFSYVMTVSFDKPIKSVSYKDAEISKDGKSFTKKLSMGEIIKNPSVLAYKVELKK